MPPSNLETIRRLAALDDGWFEQLVIRYLVDTFSELRGIAVTGINEDGKPIPCPVDGVHFLPGSPPTCIFVASTTMARNSLRDKWLKEGDRAGDVPKAIGEFVKWQMEIGGVAGRLFLATNRMLGGDSTLYRDAIAAATNAGLSAQIIEASGLLRYLDDTPKGQMTRQELLHIPANTISAPLLQELSIRSLSLYWSRYGSAKANTLIDRAAITELRRLVDAPGGPVAVVGPSGFGKTILSYKIAQEWVATRRIALWIPADDVVAYAPLTTTLSAILIKLHPTLARSAGEDALRLVNEQSVPMLLLVDDVNRSASPATVLQTVTDWHSQGLNATGSCTIVPLWTTNATQLPIKSSISSHRTEGPERTDYWRHLTIGAYTTEERNMLQEKRAEQETDREGSAASLKQIVDTFDGDPFLCGLIPSDFVADPSVGRAELVRRVFEEVIDRACRLTADQARLANFLTTASEVGIALDGLLDISLEDDMPEPEWRIVRARLGDRLADILHHLAETNELGWIANEPHQTAWRWKHNRLRDALVGRRLAIRAFREWNDAEDIREELCGFLDHPGLAEAWALSLVFAPGVAGQIRLMRQFALAAPLALAHALRLSLFPNEAALRHALRDGLKGSLAKLSDRKNEFVKSHETLIIEQLLLTDDPLVLDITENLPRERDIDFARLRNGDIEIAIRYIAEEMSRGEFVPGIHYRQLETALAGCNRFHSADDGREMQFLSHMEVMLREDSRTDALVTTLGYMARPKFALLIVHSWGRRRILWENSPTDQRTEGYTTWLHHLWALGRCCTQETKPVLAELLTGVERFDETPGEHGASERHRRFVRPMGKGFGLRHAITPFAAEVWAETVKQRNNIARDLLYACRHLEHPELVETYVRWAAVAEPHHWGDFTRSWDVLADPQPIPQDRIHRATVFQNESVLNRLWEIIKGDPEIDVRRLAFDIWKRSAGIAELSQLRQIPEGDLLFDATLAVRVRLADRTAAPMLARKIIESPKEWCGYAPRLYHDNEVRQTFLDNFAIAITNESDTGNAPGHIPTEYVPEFVERHKSILLKKRCAWVSLLLTNAPVALPLVREAISNASEKDMELLFFGNYQHERPLTRRMLDALVPVLGKLDERDIPHIVEYAIRYGHIDWVTQHLPEQVFKDDHRSCWLTEKDIRRCLDFLAERVPQGLVAVYATSEYHNAIDNDSHRLSLVDRRKILRAWAGSTPTPTQMVIAAMAMAEQGTASDFAWWEGLAIGADASRVVWGNARRLLQIRRWSG